MLEDVFDWGPSILAAVHTVLGMGLVMCKQWSFLAVSEIEELSGILARRKAGKEFQRQPEITRRVIYNWATLHQVLQNTQCLDLWHPNTTPQKQTKHPVEKSSLHSKTRSNARWKRKNIETHDLPQTRHLKVCLGLSGFGAACGSVTSSFSSLVGGVVGAFSDVSISYFVIEISMNSIYVLENTLN